LSRRVQIVERDSTSNHNIITTKNYVWIGSEIAEERASNGTTVTKRFFPQGEQQLISGTLTPFYYFRDHLGSVRELMSSTGTIAARYGYDPYGRTTLVSGTNLATFQYTGDYVHQPSGLNLTLFRAYDPNTGRWLNRDPIAENGGLNLYGYCADDPTDFTDPLGLVVHGMDPCAAPCMDEYLKKMGLGSLIQLLDAMDQAQNALSQRLRQLALAQAGNIDDAVALENTMHVMGKNGQTLGVNPFVDQWENTPEAQSLQNKYFAKLGLGVLFASRQQNYINRIQSEIARQRAFISFAQSLLDAAYAYCSEKNSKKTP
jgi:RHS repeat-associated protein